MLIRQRLINFTSIQGWLETLDPRLREKAENIVGSSTCLSLNQETRIKKIMALSPDAKKLLRRLLSDPNGLNWPHPSPECPSMELIDKGLARYDQGHGERLLKPTKWAFHDEIKFLVGLSNCY